MWPLTAAQLLHIWEQGSGQSTVQQALLLLSVACPDKPPDALAALPVGQRDARLLTLREGIFGPQLVCLVACTACSERLELTCNVADIRIATQAEPAETFSWSGSGYQIEFRLPNSLDLAAISHQENKEQARRQLFERCLLTATHNSQETAASKLPPTIIEAVADRMAESDPQADVQMALTCAACGHQWQAIFDIVSFLWAEINAWAYRILEEVHYLASAYSWREADILAMSPWRRQYYLEAISK
jgi:hypothetical protein